MIAFISNAIFFILDKENVIFVSNGNKKILFETNSISESLKKRRLRKKLIILDPSPKILFLSFVFVGQNYN